MTVLGIVLTSLVAIVARPEPPVDVPVAVAFDDIRDAYRAVVADEVTVTLNGPARLERTEAYIVRLKFDASDSSSPSQALFELGSLRLWLGGGRIAATYSTNTDQILEATFDGPITLATIARAVPPVFVPQLALADAASSPLPFIGPVSWTSASADESERPPLMSLVGSTPHGPVTLTADLVSARLRTFAAVLRGGDDPVTIELVVRAIDAGDPATWEIKRGDRQPVATLAELIASRPPKRIAPGQPMPDLTLTRDDMTPWSLNAAMPLDSTTPLAILLFRSPSTPERAAEITRDARTGLAVLRAMKLGQPVPGGEPSTAPRDFESVAASIIELGEYRPERIDEAARGLGTITRDRATSGPAQSGADALMWAPSAANSIERFSADAAAIIIVVGPDRRLRGIVTLDARSDKGVEIARELAPLLAP
ncbi:MAG: hypothetical protein ACKVW3_12190 [Phycisphaerales bacterium]